MTAPIPFSPEDDAAILLLLDYEKLPWVRIARIIRRSPGGIPARYSKLKNPDPDGGERRNPEQRKQHGTQTT